MDKILHDLLKNCTSCIEEMEKNEEWKVMKEELKNMMMKSDDEGVKKMSLLSNDVFEVLKEELKKNEDELKGMNVDEVVNELEKKNKKVNVGDSKVYVFSDGKKKTISNELMKNNEESLLSMNMIDIDYLVV